MIRPWAGYAPTPTVLHAKREVNKVKCTRILFIYLFNINLVQEYTRREKKGRNRHIITVETKLYAVSQLYQQRRPY